MDVDEVEGGYVDGATGANALAGDVEELPVEIETLLGAHEVVSENEVDEEFFLPTLRGSSCAAGMDITQRGWADDEGGVGGEAGGDGVSEGVAVERGYFGGADVDEGEDDDRVLIDGRGSGGFAEALGEHGEDASGALFFFGGVEGEAVLRGAEGDVVAGKEDRVELHGHHYGLEGFADFGGGSKAGGGLLFEAMENDGLEFDRECRGYFADRRRIGELDCAYGLELGRVGAVEGMTAGGELVEDEAEGEDVGLD